MSDRLVFNHHTLPFDSPAEACAAMPDFLRIAIKARPLGFEFILIEEAIDASWFRVRLANNYYWQDWYQQFKDLDQYRDLIRAFRSIATRQPLFSPEEIIQDANLFDVRLPDGETSFSALQAAVWHEAPLISFPTRPPWNQSPMVVVLRFLDENARIKEEDRPIINFFSLEAFEEHELEFQAQRLQSIHSGKELIRQWENIYAFLYVCGKVKDQLFSWSRTPVLLAQVKESLHILNQFAQSREAYTHDKLRSLGLNHPVSGESESVGNNLRLRKQREFYLPDGRQEYFENHIKLSHGFRIHFWIDEREKKVFVGYVGQHLPLR